MAIVRAKHQELDKDPRLQDPSDDFYGKFEEFAMFKCTYYQCYKCKKPYFGGLADCGQGEDRPVDEKELICPQCSAASVGAGVTNCAIHGTDYIDFKCRFCCNISLFFCFGTTHYCDTCHRQPYTRLPDRPNCNGDASKCQLGIKHPIAADLQKGEEFALGCGLCRSKCLEHDEDM